MAQSIVNDAAVTDDATDVNACDIRPLQSFYHPDDLDGAFTFSRFYWDEGAGDRESVTRHVTKKRRPVPSESDGDTAARVETLLPSDAPEEYVGVDALLLRYEEWLAVEEVTAMAQVTFRFIDSPNIHHPYEKCRAFIRAYFVDRLGLPTIMILHAPYLHGSLSTPHVPAIILPAQLTRYGWLKVDRKVATDAGRRAVLKAWSAFAELGPAVDAPRPFKARPSKKSRGSK